MATHLHPVSPVASDEEVRAALFQPPAARALTRVDQTFQPRSERRSRLLTVSVRRVFAAHRTTWLALAVGAIVLVVTAIGAYTGPIRFDDEGTYVSQAVAVLHGQLSPYTYWYDHPPVGWIVLAGWMGGPGALFPGPNAIATGRQLMVVLAGLSAALVTVLVRRFGGTSVAAVIAGLAFGLSPIAIQFHRMVMLDNLAVAFVLLAWVIFAGRSRALAPAALAGLSLAIGVLCKETLLLMVPFIAWTAWQRHRGETGRMCLAVASLSFVLPLSFYPLFALLKGELLPGPGHVSLWDGVVFQLFSRRGSGSVFDPTSDAHAVVSGWFATDWYLLAAGAALAPLLLLRRGRWPLFGAVLLSALVIVRPGYLPVPYVVWLVPLAAIALGLGLDEIGRRAFRPLWATNGRVGPWRRAVAAVSAVALTAAGAVLVPPALQVSAWRDSVYLNHDFDFPYRQSSAWLAASTPADAVVVCDNVTWTDLVLDVGRPQSQIVWYTKLGVDEDVNARIRRFGDIDYVVVTDIMRTGQRAAILDEALKHATQVRTWGQGAQAVEVWRVNH